MRLARDIDEEKHHGVKIAGLGYDGRQDTNTRAMVSDSHGKLHLRRIKEEHVTVTEEPEGRYLWHFVPDDPVYPEKPALKVAQALYDFLVSYDSLESLQVLQGDSFHRIEHGVEGRNPRSAGEDVGPQVVLEHLHSACPIQTSCPCGT